MTSAVPTSASKPCPHIAGAVIIDPDAPNAFTHPAQYCSFCRLWIRHPAYPAPTGPHDEAQA